MEFQDMRLLFDEHKLKILLSTSFILILGLISKDFIAFAFFTVITFIFNYFQNRFKLPFDVSPMIFFSLLIATKFSIMMMILFILIAGILPTLITGGEIGVNTLIFIMHIILLNSVFSYLKLGIGLLTILYPIALGALMFSVSILSNQEALKRITIPAMSILVNMAYFLNLGIIFKII